MIPDFGYLSTNDSTVQNGPVELSDIPCWLSLNWPNIHWINHRTRITFSLYLSHCLLDFCESLVAKSLIASTLPSNVFSNSCSLVQFSASLGYFEEKQMQATNWIMITHLGQSHATAWMLAEVTAWDYMRVSVSAEMRDSQKLPQFLSFSCRF